MPPISMSWRMAEVPLGSQGSGGAPRRRAAPAGRLIGRMEGLGFQLRSEAMLHTLTEDVLKSSEIEGEMLDRDQVRSSIARRLGMDIGGLTPADRDVEGVVEMMLDATQKYASRSPRERLFGWHAALFPTGRSGMHKISVGAWRDDSDGPDAGRLRSRSASERVHYEAPAADRLARGNEGVPRLVQRRAARHRSGAQGRRSRICGSSPSIRSTTATGASRARSPTWRSRARSEARSASTACRRRSGRSATPITTSSKRRRKAISTSRAGSTGSLAASAAPSTARRTILAGVLKKARFWEKHAGGGLQRTPARHAQPPARRIRGQADLIEMGQARQVLAGHGAARHRRPRRARHPEEGRGRRAQHQLFAGYRREA